MTKRVNIEFNDTEYYAVLFNTTAGTVGRVVEKGTTPEDGEHIVDLDPHGYPTIREAFTALNKLAVANGLV